MSASAERHDSSKPVRCLVIQLARLGDTIQSLMALRAAKQLYPQMEIHFLVRDSFSSAANRIPWVEEVHTLPTSDLIGDVLSGKKTEAEVVPKIAKWMAPIVDKPWDFVINWSYSDASSYLAAIIPGMVKLGYTRRENTSFACADEWSQYVQAIVQGDVNQNIHLTDILTTQLLTALQIHVGDPADNGNQPVTSKGFFSLKLEDRELPWHWRQAAKKWVAFQLGAGSDKKVWSIDNWIKLASQILRRHPDYNIVLLGGEEDREAARKFREAVYDQDPDFTRVLPFVGKTDFDLWAAIVGRCQWVLSTDTAVIHLASVLGTRVLNLSIGPVKFEETGPYGNQHYVLRPEGDEELDPKAVYGTWAFASSAWSQHSLKSLVTHFEQLGYSHLISKFQAYRSKIRPTADGGGVVYEPLFDRSLEADEWTAMVMGQVARAWYCGWVAPIGHELSRQGLSPTLLKELRKFDEVSEVLISVCDKARYTAGLLAERSRQLKSEKVMGIKDREAIGELGAKLQELDRLIERMGNTSSAFKGFSQMAKVMMHNLDGQTISELGRESADAYLKISEGVRIFRDWLQHTLRMARPVAIQGGGIVTLNSNSKPRNLEPVT